MIRAILFDMGGTLDGDGGHWLERFLALYRSFGIELPRASVRDAFDAAERRSSTDEEMASATFGKMIELHVQWQLDRLGLTNAKLKQHLANSFIEPVRKAAIENARLLATLVERGFKLGVVSNGCGNVAQLCQEFGYSPFLSVIVDSRRVGLFKPDPAIFLHAVQEMKIAPEASLMVGDSFERDIAPAKKIGMKTAWLAGNLSRDSYDPSLVDIPLRQLSDLPAALSELEPARA